MAASIGSHYDAHSADPAVHAAAVTPSDTVDLTNASTALFLNATAGQTLTVIMLGGETGILFTFVAAFTGFVPLRVTRVMATGTNATGIVALWR
jgi:hypothetical protein